MLTILPGTQKTSLYQRIRYIRNTVRNKFYCNWNIFASLMYASSQIFYILFPLLSTPRPPLNRRTQPYVFPVSWCVALGFLPCMMHLRQNGKKPYRKPPRKSRAFEVACLRLTQQYSYKHSWLIRVLQPKNKLWFLFLWFIFSGKLVLLVDSVQYMYLIRRVRFRICHFDTRCMF